MLSAHTYKDRTVHIQAEAAGADTVYTLFTVDGLPVDADLISFDSHADAVVNFLAMVDDDLI